jgi:hypothetical protein
MAKITIKNLDGFAAFPRTFTIEVSNVDSNPLCYTERSRNKSLYAEFYLATKYGDFTFPTSVIWELDERSMFILALGFEPITEINGKKLDANDKKAQLKHKGDMDIGFFKVRAATMQDIIADDARIQKELDAIAKGWQKQIANLEATNARMEASYKAQISSMEKSTEKFMEEQIIDAHDWKRKIYSRLQKAAISGSRPLGIKTDGVEPE